MKEYHVQIPAERFALIQFKQEDLPGVAVIHAALRDFQPKAVFAWHCSVILQLEDLVDNGMPSSGEQEVIDKFGDFLDEKIKGPDKEKPNALFLARITWNATRELIWRVFDPKLTNEFLSKLISGKTYERPFDYRIDHDKEWELARWHLKKFP